MVFTDIKKKVKLELVGLDGNAFALMGAFNKEARREGWSNEERDAVLDECRSGDYDHLLCTLTAVCESPEGEEPIADEDLRDKDDEHGDEDDED